MVVSDRILPFEIDGVQYAVPMEYVAYIISTAEPYPNCVPPKRNPCVACVMCVDQDLVTVVELNASERTSSLDQCQRPFVLVLRYDGSLIGLLTDHISSLLESSVLKSERDSVSQKTHLISDTKHFILFDVPAFYRAFIAK